MLINIQNHLSQLQNIDANIIAHKNEIQELITFSQVQLDDLRTTLEKIKTGKQIAEDVQQQARTLQLTTVSLLQEINLLGGSDKLIEHFERLQKISKYLESLDSQIQSSINAFLNNYLPNFEAGKSHIEQWRKDVFLKTEQALNKMNQVYQSIDESSKKLNQDYYYAKTNLKKLEEKELELREIFTAITELTKSLGGEKLFINVTKQMAELDDFIASEKRGSSVKRDTLIWVLPSENDCKAYSVGQKLKPFQGRLSRLKLVPEKSTLNMLKNHLEKTLLSEFQDLLSEEIKKLEVKYLQEINRLDQENKKLKKSFGLTSIGLFGR